MRSYPFDSKVIGTDSEGAPILDRLYDAADLRMQIRRAFSNGVGQYPSDNMQVVANQEMTVRVMPGFGNINGCIFEETEERVMNIQASDALDRIDRVVIRFNNSDAIRSVDLGVLKGVPASIPVAPELTQNNEYFELGIANVFIPKNSVAISQSRITDLRLNEAYCGIMSATGQVGTTTLYNQYQASLEEYMAVVQAALDQTLYQQLMDQINANKSTMQSTNYAITDSALKTLYGSTATLKSILQALGVDYIVERKVENGFTVEKWASGKLVQYRRVSVSLTFSASGNLSISNSWQFTFPENFASLGNVQVTVYRSTNDMNIWAGTYGYTDMQTHSARCIAISTALQNMSVVFNVLGIGTWK